MIYEIINPSDACTVESESFEAAALATMLMANGRYGLKSKDGAESMPPQLFGDPTRWFQDRFGRTLDEAIKENCLKSAKCLESFVYGSFDAREFYLLAIKDLPEGEAREKYAADWADKRRSSMTNIGAMAKHYSEMFRTYAEREGITAPADDKATEEANAAVNPD